MNNRQLIYIAFCFSLFFSACKDGCRSGLDVGSLPLDNSLVINLGKKVKDDPSGPESVYAQIHAQTLTDAKNFEPNVRLIDTLIEEIRTLPKKLPPKTFSESEALKIDQDVAEKMSSDFSKDIKPLVADAENSANGAKALVAKLAPYAKDAGDFDKKLIDFKTMIPSNAQGPFDALAKKIKEELRQMYGKAVKIAQSHLKSEFFKEASNIESKLLFLQEKVNTLISVLPADRDGVRTAVRDAQDAVTTLKKRIQDMDRPVKVPDLILKVQDLENKILSLDPSYVKKVTDPTENSIINDAYLLAKNFAQKLSQRVRDYPSIDDLKSPGDSSLKMAIERAFERPLALVSSELDIKDTDLLELVRILSRDSKKVMFIPKNPGVDSMVLALAAMIVYKKADDIGLNVDNIYALNYPKIEETIKSYNIEKEKVNIFMQDQIKKIHTKTSDGGKLNNIYVIDADKLPNVNIFDLVSSLKNPGRILVLSSKSVLEVFGDKDDGTLMTFKFGGLSAQEALIVAENLARKLNDARVRQGLSRLDSRLISESVSKAMRAFVPEKTNLDSVTKVVNQVFNALANQRQISLDEDLTSAVAMAIVASFKEISVGDILSSSVMSDDVKTVDEKVKRDPGYYSQMSKRGFQSPDMAEKFKALENQNTRLEKSLTKAETSLSTFALNSSATQVTNDANNIKGLYNDAVEALKAVVEKKKALFDNSFQAINTTLILQKDSAIDAFQNMINTANDCYSNIDETSFKNFWPEANRIALANIDIVSGGIPNNLKGDVNSGDKNTFANCFIYGSAEKNKVVDLLGQYKEFTKNSFNNIYNNLATCKALNNDFDRFGDCAKSSISKFDEARRSFAQGSRLTSLNKMAEMIKQIPKLSDVTASRDLFNNYNIRTPAGFNLVNPDLFGSWLKSANADQFDSSNAINRLFYIKNMLKISGSDFGQINLHFGDIPGANQASYTIHDIRNDGTGKMDFIKNVIPNDFAQEDLALMNQAIRSVMDNYDKMVAYVMANILYEKVARKIKNDIVNPFFSLSGETLLKFQEAGAPGTPEAIRKEVWDRIKELTGLINNLKDALDKDFVINGLGLADTADMTIARDKLFAVGVAYQAIGDKINQITGSLMTGPGAYTAAISTLAAGLRLLVQPIADRVYQANELVKLDTKKPWVGAPGVVPLTATTSDDFLKAFEDAYDMIHYFKVRYTDIAGAWPNNRQKAYNLVLPAVTNERKYPAWHKKASLPGLLNTLIAHPLDPDGANIIHD